MAPKLCLSIVVIVFFNILSVTNGNSYQDQCVNDGDVICTNCKTVGLCVDTGTEFRVDFQFTCDAGEVCSNQYNEDGSADCYRLSSNASPDCMCDASGSCSIDPYNDVSYVECGDDGSRVYGTCLTGDIFNLESCECEFECPECGYYSADDGSCENYISCVTGVPLSGRCPDGFCFDDTECSCKVVDAGCPECGFEADPEDTEGFYYCETSPSRPGKCPNGYRFDESTCSCTDVLPATTSDPETTTLSGGVNCAECGYAPYPNDICDKYYKCNLDGTVSIEDCPPGLCYSEVTCACDLASK